MGPGVADSAFGFGCDFGLVSVVGTGVIVKNKLVCPALVVVQIKSEHHARLTTTIAYHIL